MKVLLIAEYRDGKLLSSTADLINFAELLHAESSMLLIGNEAVLPAYGGTLYLADVTRTGEFNPSVHKQLILEVVAKEQPQMVVVSHSSYGWDLAPRLAIALNAAQISEVLDIKDGELLVPSCNSKLRRKVKPTTEISVVTLQAGAFTPSVEPSGSPTVIKLETTTNGDIQFLGYEAAEATGIDLSKAEIIVSAGRGIGKPENLAMIKALAKALKGEYGASRPVVDAEWTEHSRQVGTTGQTVSPKLYIACGISGAIQHLAGMKKSEFILAINTDKDAPIGEVADVLAVADLKQLVPILTEKLNAR
jgi:electron transfer flavoprotein alpha subunit